MIFTNVLQLIARYRYFILFPVAAFEGPGVAFIAGFLVSLGTLSFLPAYLILVMGDIVPDTIYYYIGRYGEQKTIVKNYGSKVGITQERFDTMKHLWHTHGFKTMFISKLAYGLSTIFLISAGLSGMTNKKFYLYNLPITFIQYLVFLILGFYFGTSYTLMSKYFQGAEIIIGILGLIVIFLYYRFLLSMKHRVFEDDENKK